MLDHEPTIKLLMATCIQHWEKLFPLECEGLLAIPVNFVSVPALFGSVCSRPPSPTPSGDS
jgi:hypothetical protein